MLETCDWTIAFPHWLAAAYTVRTPAPFDEAARARIVIVNLTEAGEFQYWPVIFGGLMLALPHGWIGLLIGLAVFGFGVRRAKKRRASLEAELRVETSKLREAHSAAGRVLSETVIKAGQGEGDAVRVLLELWRSRVGDSLCGLTFEAIRQPDGTFLVGGRGIDRTDVPTVTPRIGRGGRTFHDKRKAGDIDRDLAEWNSGAVIAALSAMFGSPSPLRVAVRLTVANEDGNRIPWVTLATELDGRKLSNAVGRAVNPSQALRQIGGDVGSCRNQHYKLATEPTWGTSTIAPTLFPDRVAPRNRGAATASLPGYASGVIFGEKAFASAAQPVPQAPPRFQPTITISVSATGLGGDFAAEARKRVAIVGNSHAAFVPFQSYWSTYAQMNSAQTAFYFHWRTAARNGQFVPTDLSYIFIHVYELLHIVGALNATDAATQLTNLWMGYRSTYPKLDNYLFQWITDLYATEVSTQAALDFVQQHVDIRTHQCDELLLVVNPLWTAGDYVRITPTGLAMLLAERRLGDNKFVREHNAIIAGQPWIEGAYRTVIHTADVTHHALTGLTPREVTLKASGQRAISRPAFSSAVYSWNRKEVKLGMVPRLSDASPSVRLYRSVTRHAENLLRKERGFQGRLRGVELSLEMATAVEVAVSAYIRATKPRARVTIDVERAQQLAQESVDTRARLLVGLANESDGTLPTSIGPRSDGLLTDVDAVTALIGRLSASARALVTAFADSGWEQPEKATTLSSATDGALIGPLVDEINGFALEALGTALIVREAAQLVVQEDFRDEVYYVIRGSLDGFTPSISLPNGNHPPTTVQSFGPVELQTLLVIASGGVADITTALAALAKAHASTPLLLIDRLNECAVDSEYGDIIADADVSPPIILPDAHEFVTSILAYVEHPKSETA